MTTHIEQKNINGTDHHGLSRINASTSFITLSPSFHNVALDFSASRCIPNDAFNMCFTHIASPTFSTMN
jgi:hypothetical protein